MTAGIVLLAWPVISAIWPKRGRPGGRLSPVA
jgi:hypothetical protein